MARRRYLDGMRISRPARFCLTAVVVSLAGVAPSAALAAADPIPGPFAGKTADKRPVTFRVSRDQKTVRNFRAVLNQPNCQGEGTIRFKIAQMAIRKRGFSGKGTLKKGKVTNRVKLKGRFNQTGSAASGSLTVEFLDNSVSPTPYGAVLGAACNERVPFKAAGTRTVTEKASGKAVSLRRGMELVIRLRGGSSSTGFHWDVTKKPTGLKLVSRNAVKAPGCGQGNVGCPEIDVRRYRATRVGRTSLQAKLFPPGTGRPATKTFDLGISVTSVQPRVV